MSNINNDNNSHNKKEISDTTKMLHDKILLSFILVLGVIAVFIWTIFLIQISNIAEQTKILEEEHIEGSKEAKDNVLKSKEASSLNVQMTKTNKTENRMKTEN